MKQLTKQEFNQIIAQVAEFGTGMVQIQEKEPPWLVRNIDGFIYAVENMREHIVCTVLVPACILKNRISSELEDTVEQLMMQCDDRYGYAYLHIADIPLIAISAYYVRDHFDTQRDIPALEHHALHILNEI